MGTKVDFPMQTFPDDRDDIDLEEQPDPSVWPHFPLLVSVNASSVHTDIPIGPLPIGLPFHFSSDLFVGQCILRIKNIKNDNSSADSAYFSGRKRMMQVIVQGRFKEPLKVGDVLTGHEFSRPFLHIPPPFLVNIFSKLMNRLSPATDISIHSEHPYILAPLATIMQSIAIHHPGEEPELNRFEIDEDTTLWGGCFSEGPSSMSPSKRKRYFGDIDASRRHTFDTSHVYTFDFYQDLLDLSTYSLKMGFFSLSLDRYLNGQPVQIMCKTKDGRYLWNFQIWHACLLGSID